MISRFARWYDQRPVEGDAGLAGLLLVVFVLPADLTADTGAAGDLAFSVALLACVPFRRRDPVAVFAAVSLICLVQLAVLDHIVAGDVVALIALYTLVAYGPSPRLGGIGTACAVAGALIAAVRWESTAGDVSPLEVAVTVVASVLLAATLGAWRRSRRTELAALRERNRLLAIERDQQAAIERARIARELHDVIAHSLSVIVVQADGAAAGAEARPDQAAGALRTIADTGRDALAQMRRLLGILRAEHGDAELMPQPGTAQLDALVEQVARAGLPARLAREGEPRSLPGTIDVTLYRLAQEALTNVLKHAGAVSRVDIVLRYRNGAVELLVRDDGRGARAEGDSGHDRGGASQTADGGGHGLVGMRERVEMHDGTLEAGPAEGGGFAVHAVIPAERVAARV